MKVPLSPYLAKIRKPLQRLVQVLSGDIPLKYVFICIRHLYVLYL